MTPAALDAAYRGELVGSMMSGYGNKRQNMEMLQWMSSNRGGRLDASQTARAWIWADLHLDHADIVWCFDRPFRTVEGMRRALLETWRETVDDSEMIICLGDVTVGPPRPVVDEALGALPGEKVLVVGNHEFAAGNRGVKSYGFEAVYPTLVCETDPPLLLTHEPLTHVPPGTVNVHGHLHGPKARTMARWSKSHLNVNCELTAYRPMRLTALAATGRALLAGELEPQATTARTVLRARASAATACRRRADDDKATAGQ